MTSHKIDPKSLGGKLWLVEISPAYEYKDNHRTDTIIGYRYTIALPEKGLDKIAIKIDGEQRIEVSDGYVEVLFDGLSVYLLVSWRLYGGRSGYWYPSCEPQALMRGGAGEADRVKTMPPREVSPRRQRRRRLRHKG